MKPLAYDFYCGLGGWAEGFLSEGFDVIGFDVERHDYGTGGYPAQLVLQDVRTIHGAQLIRGGRIPSVLVASPPCQKYSYMAMPWKKAKALAKWYRESPERIAQLNELFDACFRIQREACEAAGRYIPLIVENVRGAQPWVGRSAWNFGSYHLWGDVPALMPIPFKVQKFNPDGTAHPPGSWFAVADSKERGSKLPAGNCSPRRWDEREVQRLCDATKVAGLDWSAFGKPGYKAQGFNVTAAQRYREDTKCGGSWFGKGNDCSLMRQHSSKSDSRKAASAQIAKIPFPLAQHIAKCFCGAAAHP